jgi:hypothetical protein
MGCVADTFPHTARRPAYLRLELWDKDALVDDLMGVADIELTSADGLRLANLDGVAHDYEVRLPTDNNSANEESHMLVTAVVSVRMTLVACEPREPTGDENTPNRMMSVNRRIIASSTFESLRDSSFTGPSVDEIAMEGTATPSGQSHKGRAAEVEGVKGRASLSATVSIAKVAKISTALSMQSVVNDRGIRCVQALGPNRIAMCLLLGVE